MRHGSIATRLARATRADLAENRSMFAEMAAKGEDYASNLINVDILRAIRGEPGPVLFPHIRGAVKDLMSAARVAQWQGGYGRLAGMGDDGEGLNIVTSLDEPTPIAPNYAPVASVDDRFQSTAPTEEQVTQQQIAAQAVAPTPTRTVAPAPKPTAPAPSAPASGGMDWGKIAASIVGAGAAIGGAVVTSQAQAAKAKQMSALQRAQASMTGGGGGTALLVIGIVAVLGIGAYAVFSGGNGGGGRRR